jgi:hypothetical protein
MNYKENGSLTLKCEDVISIFHTAPATEREKTFPGNTRRKIQPISSKIPLFFITDIKQKCLSDKGTL